MRASVPARTMNPRPHQVIMEGRVFRVLGLGFLVQSFGFRVQALGSRV